MPWQDGLAVALPDGVFKKHERWAWANIARGEIADMARYPGDEADEAAPDWWLGKDYTAGDKPDAQKPETFKPHHQLSEVFLRTVIFHEPFASAPERPGVRVAHAHVKEAINWSGRQTKGELWLDRCRFEQRVVLQDVQIAGLLRLHGTVLNGPLNAAGLEVKGYLYLRDMKRLGSAQLIGARIGGNAQFSRSKLEGQIDLTGAVIDGALELAQVPGTEPTWGEKAELILRNARVGALAGSITAFRRNRTGKPAKKTDFPKMDLVGLRYGNLGGLQATQENTLAGATARDLVAFLEAGIGDEKGHTHKTFTPGPFRILAKELADSGHMEKARDILFAMGEHERRCANLWQTILLCISAVVIGFGYKNHRAVAWFFAIVAAAAAYGLVITGATHLAFTYDGVERLFQWMWFSFGNAVPLITLDETHKTFLAEKVLGNAKATNIPTYVGAPFYIAKVLGFLTLTYLAASVSGLATRADK
jgi:hypothetical protein